MNGSMLDDLAVSLDGNEAPLRRSSKEINCLWASRIGGRIVGLVHLVGAEGQAVSVTLFRVDPEYRHTAVLTNLIDRVRNFCGQRGCTAVHIDSHLAPHWVLQQFDARGLRRVRRTVVGDLDRVEFRVDPSWRPAHAPPHVAGGDDADTDWPAIQEAIGALVGANV